MRCFERRRFPVHKQNCLNLDKFIVAFIGSELVHHHLNNVAKSYFVIGPENLPLPQCQSINYIISSRFIQTQLILNVGYNNQLLLWDPCPFLSLCMYVAGFACLCFLFFFQVGHSESEQIHHRREQCFQCVNNLNLLKWSEPLGVQKQSFLWSRDQLHSFKLHNCEPLPDCTKG